MAAYPRAMVNWIINRWKRVKQTIYYVQLLCALRRKRTKLNRELNRKHYPIRWRQQIGLVSDDIAAYLTYEGKGKEDSLNLLDKLYQSWKDIYGRMTIYTTLSLIISAYIASYVTDIQLPISWQGITLEKDPTVLAILLTFGAYLGLRAVYALGHQLIIRNAIISLINNAFDPQLGNALKSAYLHENHTAFYSAASNPLLITTFPVNFLLTVSALISLLALAIIPFLFAYVNIEAIYYLYNLEHRLYFLHLLFVTIAVGLSLASLGMLLIVCAPLRYRDWSTNSKFEILEQLNPKELDAFRHEVYGELTLNAFAIETVYARLKR
jgi:hypothetical protein